jgi:hypothetical protein
MDLANSVIWRQDPSTGRTVARNKRLAIIILLGCILIDLRCSLEVHVDLGVDCNAGADQLQRADRPLPTPAAWLAGPDGFRTVSPFAV